MAISISYMGTKKKLAPSVADVIAGCRPGPLLDLFSGTCAVGSAVGQGRQLWCNDIQRFAATVASAYFTSKDFPISSMDTAEMALRAYQSNKNILGARFESCINVEKKCLLSNNTARILKFYSSLPHVANSPSLEKERRRLAKKPSTFPYRLFSITFAGGYFGLSQAIDVDSIRYTIDYLSENNCISTDQHRWMLLALGQTISKVSTTTGHFAQFAKINARNSTVYIRQRNRSVWREWLNCIDGLIPEGTAAWRNRNKVFQMDGESLLERLAHERERPSVVYADPPYTSDQYSRYYHVYETLLLYDYPASEGEGRYRPNRFRSSFSIKSEVGDALESVISKCSNIGATLILSYPNNGLLQRSNILLPSLLRKYFSRCEMRKLIGHNHSSLGSSKGRQSYPVTEMLFVAR